MKICLSCFSPLLLEADWHCSHCSWYPQQYGKIPLFAPQMAYYNMNYDPIWYEELARLEAGNFWFVARNRLIAYLAKRYVPENSKYMEIGCGTGFVLQMMRVTFPEWDMLATDTLLEGIAFAQKRAPEGMPFLQMDACAIPFRDEFEVIGAFDVLEHIPDDNAAIRQIHMALKDDGIFLASVPQHRFLWSKYDEASCHHRRYGAHDLEQSLKKASFSILVSTSFNALLMPLMLLSRYLRNAKKNEDVDMMAELKLSPLMNRLLAIVLHVEYWFIQFGVRFPLGGSRIIVARKNREMA